MRLWLDPSRMAARGISASDVAAAIQANNYQSAPGQAKGYFTVTNVSANTGLADVAQFKEMVVKSKNGALVRLEDIATVDLAAQSWTSSVAMNGQHAVFIGVQATPAGNPLDPGRAACARCCPRSSATCRPRSRCRSPTTRPSSSRPRSTRSSFRSALAVVIVVVVIFLFLGSLRAVLIPIVTIPLSLIGAGMHHGGPGLQPQPVDLAGDGAGDRARRRRCDRRRRKRLPPYRGGPHSGAGGPDRRARDRRARSSR